MTCGELTLKKWNYWNQCKNLKIKELILKASHLRKSLPITTALEEFMWRRF
jgi:hypothetical protein